MPFIFRTGSPTNFRLGIRVRRLASATSAVTSKVKDQGRKVTWRVWQVLADKSRTKRLRNTKIGTKVVHLTGNNAQKFQGLRSKIKVTRPSNAETVNTQYLPNEKAYTNFKLGRQTERSMKTRISSKRRDLQGQRSRSQSNKVAINLAERHSLWKQYITVFYTIQ